MDNFIVLPPLEIERVTNLLQAASWCKSNDMELVLAETIKKFISPVMMFQPTVQETEK